MTKSYHLTLVDTKTQQPLEIDIEQTDAITAQNVAEGLYSGYRVIRISNNLTSVLGYDDYRHTEGALGDDLDF